MLRGRSPVSPLFDLTAEVTTGRVPGEKGLRGVLDGVGLQVATRTWVASGFEGKNRRDSGCVLSSRTKEDLD